MPPLDDATLDELEKAEAAMTAAPWALGNYRGFGEEHDLDGPDGDLSGDHRGMFNRKADAAGIALLRNHARAVIASARRLGELEAENKRLREQLARYDICECRHPRLNHEGHCHTAGTGAPTHCGRCDCKSFRLDWPADLRAALKGENDGK